jgi:hypothetical protein
VTDSGGYLVPGAKVTKDDTTHTITFSANLGFWDDPEPPADLCALAANYITYHWGGRRYGCYTTEVDITWHTYGSLDAVPMDVTDVHAVLVPLPQNLTDTDRAVPPGRATSDDPAYRGQIVRASDPSRSTIWQITKLPGLAHEFGHLLGLSDGYIPPSGPVVPCHTVDLMTCENDVISMEMITRVLRRNGIDVRELACPIHYFAGTTSLNMVLAEIDDLMISAYCPSWQPPTDDLTRLPDPLVFTGTIEFRAGYLAGADMEQAREFLHAVTGVDTTPLAKTYHVEWPIQFTLDPANCFEGSRVSRLPYSIDVPQAGMQFTGWYHWDTKTGLPVDDANLTLNGIPLVSLSTYPTMKVSFELRAP